MKGTAFIFGVAGAAIGAIASHFITKSICQKKHDQEFIDIRNGYEERIAKIQSERIDVEALNERKEELMHELEAKVEAEKLEDQTEGYTDYTAAFKKTVVEQEEKLINGIQFISEAEAQKYAKDNVLVGFSLYSDDVLVSDETYDEVPNEEIPFMFGDEGIAGIRANAKADSEVYILNPERGEIYDITVMEERFGVVDDEPVKIY